MTNLKLLKESLMSKKKGGRELTVQERKVIKGGYYTSETECKKECGGGPKGDYWSFKHNCVRGNDGYWSCYDS